MVRAQELDSSKYTSDLAVTSGDCRTNIKAWYQILVGDLLDHRTTSVRISTTEDHIGVDQAMSYRTVHNIANDALDGGVRVKPLEITSGNLNLVNINVTFIGTNNTVQICQLHMVGVDQNKITDAEMCELLKGY